MSAAPVVLMASPHAQWSCHDNAVRVEMPDAVVTFDGASRAMTEWLDRLRFGTAAPDGVLGTAWLDTLVAHRIVCILPAVHADIDAYLHDMAAICDVWLEGVFASPFWQRFLAGESSDVQVLAFLAQLYHRTAGADVHNRIAVERCNVPAVRPWLLRRYREARGHATQLAAGLLRCGPVGRTFIDSGAFDATHALVDFMIEAAGDTHQYLGCQSLFDAPLAVRSNAEIVAQFDALTRSYPFAAPGFEALCTQACQGERMSWFETALACWVNDMGLPKPEERLRVLRGAQGVAHAFRGMFDALHQLDEED